MKKQIWLIFIFFSGWTILIAQNSKVWDYPFGPGSTEWKNSNTLPERLSLYNIPADLLKSISTEDLVISCLNYPELRMIFTRNNLTQGYEYLRSQFNGFRELETRVDAGKCLLSVYAKKRHDDVALFANKVDMGKFMESIVYIEVILSNETIINSMELTDRIALKNQALKSFEDEVRLKDYYSMFPLELPALIMARLLIIESRTNINIKNSVDDEILIFAKNSGTNLVPVWYRVYDLTKNKF